MTSESKSKAGDRFQQAGKRLDRAFTQAAAELDRETERLIAYLNDEVIPAVRSRSSQSVRIAAEKLNQIAEYMEKTQRRRP